RQDPPLCGHLAVILSRTQVAPPMEPTWTSLLPPVLAIAFAIIWRHVYLALAAGVWLGYTILAGWNPIAGLGGAIDGAIAGLGAAANAKVIVLGLVIGALIATIEAAGGEQGFVRWLGPRVHVTSPRRGRLLPWSIGC